MEENNYYPFGMKHEGYNNVVLSEHPYKYNGKELNEELGLGWYDYGARNYDATLGRWMSVDPLAEVYYGINPYAYVFNNPAQLMDPDGMRVKYVREEGQSRKEFREAKREFKRKNRQLSKDSKTHKANFKQLKKSKNVHEIGFNRGKGSVNSTIGDVNRESGNNTRTSIDLEQKGEENEFVIAHEVGHAVNADNGTEYPFEAEYNALEDTPDAITQKMLDASNSNSEYNETEASHIENIVRGEVSESRGVVVPLRQTYTIKFEYMLFGKYKSRPKTINVIKKNYDYYKKDKKKS